MNTSIYLYLSITIVTVVAISFIAIGIIMHIRKSDNNGNKEVAGYQKEGGIIGLLKLEEEKGDFNFPNTCKPLVDFFEKDKPFLNPDLTIAKVAEVLCTNKTYLSRSINLKFKKNFNQLVHWFRIREAITIYKKNPELTVYQLCKKSGFRSMTTFNTAFQRNTGCTPAEWCKAFKRDNNIKGN